MPLNPIQLNKSSSESDFTIKPGKVVEYEQHSKPLLAVVLQEKKGKWLILNQHAAELEHPASRLYLLPGNIPSSATNNQSKAAFLEEVNKKVQQHLAEIELEEVWQLLREEVKETNIKEVVEILFKDNNLENHLSVRRALLADQVYFKRKKFGFEPRPENIVEELKVKVRVEAEKRAQKEAFVNAVLKRLGDHASQLPEGLHVLEQTAALGSSAQNTKETKTLIDSIIEQGKLSIQGKLESKAFQLLVAMGHFSPDQNLAPLRLGRPVEFSEKEIDSAAALASQPPSYQSPSRKDLRQLTTITIDGADTRDFDDALSIERTERGHRVGIHISDVAVLIPEGSVLEETALRRATSIYCPDEQIPMLPPEVSEDALSLTEGSERPAMSFFIETDDNFNILSRSIERSIIKITQRVTYEQADAILCDETPEETELKQMLLLLWEVGNTSEARRLGHGAVQFARREMNARVLSDGAVVLEDASDDTPARKLVSEMMIVANETAALFARDNSIPLIFRSQEPPDVEIPGQGKNIPEGPAREYFLRGLLKRSCTSCEANPHFGLGIEAYAQISSPIRRAADLINQRQISAFLDHGSAHYDSQKITELIAQIESGLDEAFQISRERNRYWLLKYIQREGVKQIHGVIVRVDTSRPIAELDILYSLYPFHSLGARGDSAENRKKELGRSLTLQIDSINPRSQTLVLREIEQKT